MTPPPGAMTHPRRRALWVLFLASEARSLRDWIENYMGVADSTLRGFMVRGEPADGLRQATYDRMYQHSGIPMAVLCGEDMTTSDRERALIEAFRRLDPDKQAAVEALIGARAAGESPTST